MRDFINLLDFHDSMPKKKIQHKGKPKHASEESAGDVFSKNISENTEEEYTTVVDFETKKRYNKRLIESNWSKYEEDGSDLQHSVEGDDLPKTDDLNYLLQIASSDCAHFEFSSEKLWKNQSNSVPASKIFNLDLDVLSSGLACLPFHERMGLDERELCTEDKRKFHQDAENNWKEYNAVKQNVMKRAQDEPKMKDMDNNLRGLNESFRDKLDLSESGEVNEKDECSKLTKEEKSLREGDDSQTGDKKIEKKKQNIFFSENDENLEGWLDSVLDD